MKHIITGTSFHGAYSLVLSGPSEGFTLSAGQAAKYQDALCGMTDCQCGGRANPDPGTARVIWDDESLVLRLVPKAQ